MITITVNSRRELNEMMDYAQKYVCTRMSFSECGKYPRGGCDNCFADNHIKYGIRIIIHTPVDNLDTSKL